MSFLGANVSFPRWYLWVVSLLFLSYLGGWFYTMHLAGQQIARGDTYVMPVGPHDSTSYAELAGSLLHGHFAEGGAHYAYFHTPGYPAFVAAIRFVTGSYFAVTFVQILLVFATAFMTVALGRELASERVGLWASILFLANPLVPSIALYILTDTLFMFLFMLGILLIVRRARTHLWEATLLAGLCFAASSYVRPAGLLTLPIFIAPFFTLAIPLKKKIVASVAMLAFICTLLVPWMLRNHSHSGVFAFSSLVPFNMAYYNLPHFWSDTAGLPLGEGIARVERESGVPRGSDALGYPQNWYDLASSPKLNAYIANVLVAAPVSYTVWHLYNSLGFFINPAIAPAPSAINLKLLLAQGRITELLAAVATPWWFLAERLLTLLGIVFVGIGAWALRKRPLIFALLFIVFYIAALGGPSAQARYRLPVEPVLSICIVAGLFSIGVWCKERSKGKMQNIHNTSSMATQSTEDTKKHSSLLAWIMRTPLLAGIRGALGGKMLIRAIEAKRGTILYYNEPGRAERFDHMRKIKWETRTLLLDPEAMFLYEAVRAVAKVPGDIGEVGTYRGGSARLMAEASEGKKQIHTFDTFEGLPPLVDFDAKRFTAGQFATSAEAVHAYLAPYPSVHIYEGLFPDTAGPIAAKQFSFVHLDVDIYQSTLDGLTFFYPRMNKGGVLVSHDYSNAEGVRRAFDEFFHDKPEAVIDLPGTQCLVVKL